MRNSNWIMLVLGLGLAATAVAQEPKWTFIEGGYTRFDSDDNDATGNNTEQYAYSLMGSIGFQSLGHFMLNYKSGKVEEFDGADGDDVDYDGIELYLGAHPELNSTTDLVFDFFYFDETFDDFDASNDRDCDGYGVRSGIRSLALNEKLELNAYGRWTDGNCQLDGGGRDEDFTDFTLEVGGQYFWNPDLSTGITFTPNDPNALDGDDSVNFFVRYSLAADWF